MKITIYLVSEAFELLLTNQFVCIDCYGMSKEHMNGRSRCTGF